MMDFIIGMLIGIIVEGLICSRMWQKDLVESGHAEYYLDENHKRKWRLK